MARRSDEVRLTRTVWVVANFCISARLLPGTVFRHRLQEHQLSGQYQTSYMASGGFLTNGFEGMENLWKFDSSCFTCDNSELDHVTVRSSDHIQMTIPVKVANELHCLRPQIKDMGNTVTYSLHFSSGALNLIVNYISHVQQLRERTYVDLEKENEWERNFVQNLVCRDHIQLAEFLLAAEDLREESLRARERTSLLVKMADLVYMYGPSETIVDIIELHSPYTTLSRIQSVFSMLYNADSAFNI